MLVIINSTCIDRLTDESISVQVLDSVTKIKRLFLKDDESFYNECIQKIPFINDIIKPLFKTDVFSKEVDRFNFGGIFENLIFNPFEAQIDTGNMMQALLKKAHQNGILILNSQRSF